MFINKQYFLLSLILLSANIKGATDSKGSHLKHLIKAGLAGAGTVIVGTKAFEKMKRTAQLFGSHKEESLLTLSEEIGYFAIFGYSAYILFKKSSQELEKFLL